MKRIKSVSKTSKQNTDATTGESIKKHKYNACKVEIDGVIFDSKNEADYYINIVKPGLETGEILSVVFHPQYVLVPSFERNVNGLKRKFRQMTYSADFRLELADHSIRLIDIKGMVTSDFKLKYKMFNYLYDDMDLILLKARRSKKQIIWEEVKL